MPRSPQPRSQFTAPAYKVPRAPHPIDLRLDGNEGRGPSEKILQALDACSASSIRRYPSCRELESEIAERYGVEPDQGPPRKEQKTGNATRATKASTSSRSRRVHTSELLACVRGICDPRVDHTASAFATVDIEDLA